MEKLLDLEEIVLLPSVRNLGECDAIPDKLPLITPPEVVDMNNYGLWKKNGIEPVFPIDELKNNLDFRLKACTHMFTEFTPEEIIKIFLDGRNRVPKNSLLMLYMSVENVGSPGIYNLCKGLKSIYGKQVSIMLGDLRVPEQLEEFTKIGVDYVVFSSKNLFDTNDFFFYPVGTLLIEIEKLRTKNSLYPQWSKVIIKDINGIENIIKALALGADYVMPVLHNIIEAAGKTYYKYDGDDDKKRGEYIEIDQEKGVRPAVGQFRNISRSSFSWRVLDTSLETWIDKFKHASKRVWTFVGATTWGELRKNVHYGRI